MNLMNIAKEMVVVMYLINIQHNVEMVQWMSEWMNL